MRSKLLLLILLLLAPILVVLAATYNTTVDLPLLWSASWSASITPTNYKSFVLSPYSSWAASLYPASYKTFVLSPSSSWAASLYPVSRSSYTMSFSPSWNAMLFLSLRTFRGDTLEIDQVSGVGIGFDRAFWDGGIWVSAVTPVQLLLKTDRDIYVSRGNATRTSEGILVSLPEGRTLIAENATISIVDLVDPQGSRKYGVTVLMNDTVVEPYRVYKFPMHTYLNFRLSGGGLGSVYLNGTKVTLPIYIGNHTGYRFVLTVKGTMLVKNVTSTFSGSGSYVRLTVKGAVMDKDYNIPVKGATVYVYVDNGYAGYDISREDGSFMVDVFVRRPSRRSVTVKVNAVHDDYESITVSQVATVPQVPLYELPSIVSEPLFMALITGIVAISAVAVISKVFVAKRRKGQWVKKKGT